MTTTTARTITVDDNDSDNDHSDILPHFSILSLVDRFVFRRGQIGFRK